MPAPSPAFQNALRLHRAGDLAGAERAYLSLLLTRPRDPDALRMLGHLRAQQGRTEEAVELLRRAVAIDPSRGTIHYDLGHLLRQVGRSDEAMDHLARCVALKPDHAEAHHVLGEMLTAAGRKHEAVTHLQEAISAYERARARRPDDAALLGALASLYERVNRLDDARAAAERALASGPQPGAMLSLAKVLTRTGDLERAEATLRSLIASPSTHPETVARAHVQLGHTLDRAGRFGEAFDAVATGQRLMSEQPKSRAYGLDVFPRVCEDYRRQVLDADASTWQRPPLADGAASPIFFVGFPRSGTTLAEQILEGHPAFAGSDEAPILGRVRAQASSALGAPLDAAPPLARIGPELVRTLRAAYWTHARGLVGGDRIATRRLLDKLPLNIVELPLARLLFPDAPVIVALRDPRDVCLSCFFQEFEPNHAMVHFFDIRTAADMYARVMNSWLDVDAVISERKPTFRYRYEDLVSATEPTARAILEYLGEPWLDSLLAFRTASDRIRTTPSYHAVAEPIYTRAVERWRRYADRLEPVLPTLRPIAERLGYAP